MWSKWLVPFCSFLTLGFMAPASSAQVPPKAEHAILVVIDGFSYLAPERVDMPNLRAIMARGTYFRESYSVPPQHPHSGE